MLNGVNKEVILILIQGFTTTKCSGIQEAREEVRQKKIYQDEIPNSESANRSQ
jgi:hypothetical protein